MSGAFDLQMSPRGREKGPERFGGDDARGAPGPPDARHVVVGVVAIGRQIGRRLGFPTANLALEGAGGAALGVYVVRVELADGRRLGGVANLGGRPTFGDTAPLLEVHLFDFHEDIYGQRLRVTLLRRLRGARRFASPEALKRQLAVDVRRARALLDAARP